MHKPIKKSTLHLVSTVSNILGISRLNFTKTQETLVIPHGSLSTRIQNSFKMNE